MQNNVTVLSSVPKAVTENPGPFIKIWIEADDYNEKIANPTHVSIAMLTTIKSNYLVIL